MSGAGSALMGIGSARGENRARRAAELAISSPLLEASIDGAMGVLLSVSGGSDLGLFEVNEACELVQSAVHPNAKFIFGTTIDDALGDGVSPANLKYKADAGSRWAYHNVYVKLQDVVAAATNQTWENYFNSQLRDKIGMTGTWLTSGEDLSVYWSNTRSMARFGLLMLNKGKWNSTTIVNENYCTTATTTSQNINLGYGYLWWLNGKTSYHLPQSQLEFPGSIIPTAHNDMFMALGKNDQKIYVIPSKKMVIARMGDAADDVNLALSDFDEVLWEKISALYQ
jgi:CubicO group peptidase (beta-lactamase class C family)